MISVVVAMVLGAAPPPAFDALIAEPSDKPIVIDVFTTWCKPCAVLEAYVFPEPSVAAALSKARFVQYDAERGEGIAVAERFGISSYPTILVLAPDGTKVGQVNAQTPPEFVGELTPLLTVAAVKGPITDEAVSKPDADARAIFVFGLKTMRGPPSNLSKALTLFEQAAKRDADGKRGVKVRAQSLIAATKYRIETRALKVRTLLELARGDPSMVPVDALGALSLFPEADAAELHRIGERLMEALVAKKNAHELNELVYAQLWVGDSAGALATAKALETLTQDPNLLDTVAEAYFQAGQKDRAIALEETLVRESSEPTLKANLQRFKAEQPSPPPFSGRNPLDELDAAGSVPKKFQMPEYFAESQQLHASLVDDCRRKAGKAKSAWLRLTFAEEKVTRAQAFDVEVPPALKKCLEENAKKKTVKELSSHSPWTMEIVFDPN